MANIKPENLDWLDDLGALKAQKEKTPSASYSKLAKALGLSKAKVTYLSNLTTLLEPAELERIRQAAPSYILSYNCAKALASLKKKVPDPAVFFSRQADTPNKFDPFVPRRRLF